jgi:nucleotide-binding universal stress UspA family protein
VIKKKISKILVPLDGSKNSMRGLETAITLARSCGATLTGIYSIYAPPHSEFRGVGSVEKALNVKVKKFMEEAKVLAAKHGIVFNEKIARGDIGYNIIKLAHGKEHFDMIVIGSRGRSSTKEMFFGSVSNYVIHTSKIPVVVVK